MLDATLFGSFWLAHDFRINNRAVFLALRRVDMATTIAAADTVSGTRRSIIRSQKFVEWQSQLISTRAMYSGRRLFDEAEGAECSGGKINMGKRRSPSNCDSAKPSQGLECRDAEVEDPVANQVSYSKKNTSTQLLYRQQSDVKRLSKETDFGSKTRHGQGGVDPLDQVGEDVGLVSPRTQQEFASQRAQHQGDCTNMPIAKRRQRRNQNSSSLPNERVKQSSQSFQRISSPQNLATGRGTKRSKRLAERLAHKEPPPPPPPLPLKLPKLHVVLSREEIQQDWVKITGHKYVGKPRKSTLVQRGLGLCTSLTRPSTIRYLNDP